MAEPTIPPLEHPDAHHNQTRQFLNEFKDATLTTSDACHHEIEVNPKAAEQIKKACCKKFSVYCPPFHKQPWFLYTMIGVGVLLLLLIVGAVVGVVLWKKKKGKGAPSGNGQEAKKENSTMTESGSNEKAKGNKKENKS